ncbi:PAS domain S-box-containing protein [Mesorhizobium sp. J18]|uniref:PAS domain S-box protein n=1 Tax=Mesorhizobium sp. J18 TaxID=935263 RepID=UPI001199937B|nr:PAS domain S-box protein [Mesorhizobium sp. J18]TWH00613.1 PAS domain S-box-containing protein [Mesorhizobium sp. J18]
MVSRPYSFIDIAVLNEVRTCFAAGDALAILSTDLEEVLWANGPGAALFGYSDIESAIGAPPRLSASARRQIMSIPKFPRIGRDRLVAIRISSGFKAAAVTLHASDIELPDGEPALLFALSAPVAQQASERSRKAISGFHKVGHFAALVDAGGDILASSECFSDLGIASSTLRQLVEDVRLERDRLVKRLIPGKTIQLPAGIARLTDDPATHLLVVVNEEYAEAAAGETVEKSETVGHRPDKVSGPEARRPEQQREAAQSSATFKKAPHNGDHDRWYFAEEERRDTAAAAGSERRGEGSTAEAPHPTAGPIRFVWRTDAETRFTAISEEFAEAVGPAAADVIGRRFREVANAFGLDPHGEIPTLLERRDTWSGRTVLWPIAGTALKAPVDLAALPAYSRDRTFEGFRGFGILRIGDAVDDPEAIGMALVPGPLTSDAQAEETLEPEKPEAVVDNESREEDRGRPKPIETEPASVSDEKVIHLAQHRQTREVGLSLTEQTAFREIGDRLRRESGIEQNEGTPEAGAATSDGVPDTGSTETAEESAASEKATAKADGTPDKGQTASQTASKDHDRQAASVTYLPSAFSGAVRTTARSPLDIGILSNLPLPVLIHTGDDLHYANREFLELTGYDSLEELATAGGLDAIFAEPYEKGATDSTGRTLRLRRPDGEEFPVEAHLQSVSWNQGKALLLALRRAPPLEATVVNAAEAQPDERLQELELRLAEMRTVIDTATDGVVIIDNDGMIRSISRPAEALFGFDAENVAGKPFASLFAIESQRAAQDYLTSLTDNGVASVLNDGREVIGREAQGRFIPLFMTIGRLPNDSGFCAVVRDITQWKRAEEELTQARAQAEHSSSQKSEFLARVSHEIRTPLNAIIGFSELMMDEKFGPIGSERYRDYLRDINRSGNHVLDLVNDLLDISKIEAGEQEMHYEAVSLNDTLGETVAMMQPQANRERVIIRSSFASRLPDVVADLRSVRQIALNLLSNAIRYTPAGGQVIVSTAYESNGTVVMRVRDTGFGMTAAEIEQALKPFKQLNTLKRQRGDGTGLGLPLTRAMVEANRAKFSISSTSGEGTLVEIVFPPTRVLAD